MNKHLGLGSSTMTAATSTSPSHIPTITFTLTDRTIRRHKADGSYWRKGDVQFEYRIFRAAVSGTIDNRQLLNFRDFGLYRFPPTPKCKQPHYTYTGTQTEIFAGIFGYGLDWDAALLLVKERMIAQMIARRLGAF